MSTLHRMILAAFLPVFLIALVFFVLVLQLMDLFSNLWRYLAQDTPFTEILLVGFWYLPKCISFSLPIALLFSIAFVLGSFYANNELLAIFASGMGLRRLVIPFLLIGALLSLASFFFEDRVVIDSYRRKQQLFQQAVHQTVSFSNTNVTVISADTRIVYQADYYNDAQQTLNNLTLFIRDDEMRFAARVDADRAVWTGDRWRLEGTTIIEWSGETLHQQNRPVHESEEINEPPATFRRITRQVEEMSQADARRWVEALRRAGLPYREPLTDYYRKFFFPLTLFIVALLSSAVGSTFRKNILLMSLLSSLVMSVVYYVSQMVGQILAKNGLIHPLAGAGGSFILFLVAGILLFRAART